MKNKHLVLELPFEVDARVAIQLGRESISSSLVAVSELVKNAYDADAEVVTLTFLDLDTPSPSMIIEDDGNGMNQQTIRDHWLRIGTSYKTTTSKSLKKQRILTGAKGLGRLGLDRLCDKLVLQSKTKTDDKIFELEIDWKQYETLGASLSDIKHRLYSIDSEKSTQFEKNHGTRMILESLKDDWNEEFLDRLKKELSLLVSPFGTINDFGIIVESTSKEGTRRDELSSVDFLDAAEWILNAEIGEHNSVSAKMKVLSTKVEYEFESVAWKDAFKTTRYEYPRCGPLQFQLYYLPQKTTNQLENFDFSAAKYKEFVKSNRGIRIYRDDFRVKPYGEPSGDGDWLNLAIRRSESPGGKTQQGWKVGPHQAVGAVFISRELNQELIDQTNREGIVEGVGFSDLISFAEKMLDWAERNWVDYSRKNSPKNTEEELKEETTKARENVESEISSLKSVIKHTGTKRRIKKSDTRQIAKTLPKLEEKLEELLEKNSRYEEHLNQLRLQSEKEKDTLGNLASIGILSVAFGHETKNAATRTIENARQIKGAFDRCEDIAKNEELRNDLNGKLEILLNSTVLIRNFGNFALSNVRRDKRTKKRINLLEIAKYVKASFKQTILRRSIEWSIQTLPKDTFEIRGFEIDWESIFVNLLTNAIWAMENNTRDNRKISLVFGSSDSVVTISFSDSGRGIEENTEKFIFQPCYSTKRNGQGTVIGTGMGLSIVSDFIENHYDGKISVVSPSLLGGAEFLIKIPTKLGKK